MAPVLPLMKPCMQGVKEPGGEAVRDIVEGLERRHAAPVLETTTKKTKSLYAFNEIPKGKKEPVWPALPGTSRSYDLHGSHPIILAVVIV